MPTDLPVVFLAFANEREGPALPPRAARGIAAAPVDLAGGEGPGLCELEVRTNVTLHRSRRGLPAARRPGGDLPLRRPRRRRPPADGVGRRGDGRPRRGLAGYLGGQGGLKLVFLNGCSTRPQAAELLRRGSMSWWPPPGRSTTAWPAGSPSLSTRARRRTHLPRCIRVSPRASKTARGRSPERLPARLRRSQAGGHRPTRIGSPGSSVRTDADRTEHASLAEPPATPPRPAPAPGDHRLPASRSGPEMVHARGGPHLLRPRPRGPRAVRQGPPLGRGRRAGRSSSSAARRAWASPRCSTPASCPRLEQVCRVMEPLRRSADLGLLGTLRQAFGPATDGEPFDLRAAWLRRARAGGGPSARRDPRPGRGGVHAAAEEAGRRRGRPGAREGRSGGRGGRALHALAVAFDAARPEAERPRGKLILSFRKEWLDDFATACEAAGLDCERVSLFSLDRAGVAEAIRGPAAGARYHLTIRPEDPPCRSSSPTTCSTRWPIPRPTASRPSRRRSNCC